MKHETIMLLLSIAFFITVFKLYWKPRDAWEHITGTLPHTFRSFNPVEKALCPITGYKCADAEHCDCQKICGSTEFERVKVGSHVILTNVEKDADSYYCLPKGMDRFLAVNGKLVYTGIWDIVPKQPHVFNSRGQMIACSSPFARDNRSNVLFDHKEGRPVTLYDDLQDLSEMYLGKLRYSCKCGSKDLRQNDMIAIPDLFPLACFSDHCKSEIVGAAFKGFENGKCHCGPRNRHLIPGDDTSPCITYITDHKTFSVPCIDKNNIDIATSGFYCPDTYNNDVINQVLYTKHYIPNLNEPSEILDILYRSI